MKPFSQPKDLWSVVLAGGEGERLRPLMQRWLGRHTPKQYCTFIGTRSMLQHTLDRADQVSPPEQKVTVIARAHEGHAKPQLAGRQSGKVLLQPNNRDTAAGIYLALTFVRQQDPEATVVIFPSDHFVYPVDRFIEVVWTAVAAARELKVHLVLLGVCPDKLELEYGWIQPGPHLSWVNGHRVRATQAFLEKPSLDRCRSAMAAGALWNTLILASRVETLWALGWDCFAEMMPLFDTYGEAVGTPQEGAVLDAVY